MAAHRRLSGGVGRAAPVARVLIVDADAAGHARCHLALRGLRVAGRPVQLLHARTPEDAADLLLLHADVAVAVVGAGSVTAWRGCCDPGPVRTILHGPDAAGWECGPTATGPDPDDDAVHAAVLAALRQAGRGTVAKAGRLG